MQSDERVQVGDFVDVDRSRDPQAMVAWMGSQRTGLAGQLAGVVNAEPGERVLDLGCGPGGDLRFLAAATGERGWALGIDRSRTMAETAAAAGPVLVADGASLPLADGCMDAVWIRAVLIHTPQPASVVREAVRLLRPGGRLVVCEPDHGSHLVGPCKPDLLDRIRSSRRRRFQNPTVGRDLPHLLSSAGLVDLRVNAITTTQRSFAAARAGGGPFGQAVVDAVADGQITAEEAAEYEGSLEQADRRGAFLFLATSVTATGHRSR